MKTIYPIFSLIFFLAIGCTQNSKQSNNEQVEANIEWINFIWEGDSLGGKYYEKAYLYVPFKVEGVSSQFTSQFDLGAVSVMVYGNTFRPYLELYPSLQNYLDTLNKNHYFESMPKGKFVGLNFYLDKVLFSGHEVMYCDNYGRLLSLDSARSSSVKHIGTIGASIAENKYLIINYPDQQLAILDTLPRFILENTSFVDCRVEDGRIKVPFTINDTIRYLMYDTGASLFPIMTDNDHWKKIANLTGKRDTILTSSWGEYYDVYGLEINVPVKLGDKELKPSRVYLNPRDDFKDFFQQENIMGITGNAYFFDETVVFDFKDKRFGVVKR